MMGLKKKLWRTITLQSEEEESRKTIEKEQPERKEKNQECDALDVKQRKSIWEEQMP